ncbi:MAG: SRPBCC domain-containing protein [Leptolyngbyaceae cyanobacterium RU_5_1]|nr:SRPBCC domain-containing protein [Leptolyngbyaceae cyanobacterium RU_5_1]
MPSLYTEIEINAPRRKVWRVLFHKEMWVYWNTFLYDCSPKQGFEEGQDVLLSLRRVPGDDETEFQPRITLLHPNVCLKWVSSIPGFVIEQVFELQDIGRDRTKYIHQENFSGVLTRVFLPFIRQDEQQGIRRMARELKQYVERL